MQNGGLAGRNSKEQHTSLPPVVNPPLPVEPDRPNSFRFKRPTTSQPSTKAVAEQDGKELQHLQTLLRGQEQRLNSRCNSRNGSRSPFANVHLPNTDQPVVYEEGAHDNDIRPSTAVNHTQITGGMYSSNPRNEEQDALEKKRKEERNERIRARKAEEEKRRREAESSQSQSPLVTQSPVSATIPPKESQTVGSWSTRLARRGSTNINSVVASEQQAKGSFDVWEDLFESDSEVRAEKKAVADAEERLNRNKREMKKSWRQAPTRTLSGSSLTLSSSQRPSFRNGFTTTADATPHPHMDHRRASAVSYNRMRNSEMTMSVSGMGDQSFGIQSVSLIGSPSEVNRGRGLYKSRSSSMVNMANNITVTASALPSAGTGAAKPPSSNKDKVEQPDNARNKRLLQMAEDMDDGELPYEARLRRAAEGTKQSNNSYTDTSRKKHSISGPPQMKPHAPSGRAGDRPRPSVLTIAQPAPEDRFEQAVQASQQEDKASPRLDLSEATVSNITTELEIQQLTSVTDAKPGLPSWVSTESGSQRRATGSGGLTATGSGCLTASFRSKPRNNLLRASISGADQLGSTQCVLKRSTSTLQGAGAQNAFQALKIELHDLALVDPTEVQPVWNADILNAKHILKRDSFDMHGQQQQRGGSMGGAAFRMIPQLNIGGVAQPDASAIRTIANEVMREWSGRLVWVSLREEPVVYINNQNFCVRSVENPLQPLNFSGFKGGRLEELERKLCGEILAGAEKRSGNIFVSHENVRGIVETQWESVDDTVLLTSRQVFDRLTAQGKDVDYLRIPVSEHLVVENFCDAIFDICQSHPLDPIIFSCRSGKSRSTLAMIIATITRVYQHSKAPSAKDIMASVVHIHEASLLETDISTLHPATGQFIRKLIKLTTVLPEGRAHELTVGMISELTGKSNNLVDVITRSFASEVSVTGIKMLHRYCFLVAYCHWCKIRFTKQTTLTFTQWVNDTKEVAAILKSVHQDIKTVNLEAKVASSRPTEQLKGTKRGEVLNKHMVLRSLAGCASKSPLKAPHMTNETISGMKNLRQPDAACPIFTCGRSTMNARHNLMSMITDEFPKTQEVHWIDVRAEPVVYIKGEGYLAVDQSAVYEHESVASLPFITAEKIQTTENRLREDILNEIDDITYCDVDMDSEAVQASTFERLSADDVQTPASYFKALILRGRKVVYHRVPCHEKADSWDPTALMQLIASLPFDSVIVLEDNEGGIRTTVALCVTVLIRLSLLGSLRKLTTERDVRTVLAINSDANPIAHASSTNEELPPNCAELLVASSMAQMLAAGGLLMCTEAVSAFCGRGYEFNLIDRIASLMKDEETKLKCVDTAVAAARLHLELLLSAIYIDMCNKNKSLQGSEGLTGRNEWIEERNEISLKIQWMEDHPQSGLKFVEARNLFLETEEGSVARRCGNVLTANFGLKADHFPGAIRKGMRPELQGAPNFRKVAHVNIYGVAIPTVTGVRNLLRHVGALDGELTLEEGTEADDLLATTHPTASVVQYDPRESRQPHPGNVGSLLWINLREEPILYANNKPFVLRDLANPYVNVELTGISVEKIEHVEATLAQDVDEEASIYGEQFLTHDEVKPGVMGGIWEDCSNRDVYTVRRLYEKLQMEGARVEFHRLPVTDEQSPELGDFDEMVETVLPHLIDVKQRPERIFSIVFNCQMGRGRTTTGMVVANMLVGLLDKEMYELVETDHKDTLYPADTSEWHHGNYAVICELQRTLLNGREAKFRTDLCIDSCQQMQNLRTSIEGFKKIIENETGELVTEAQRAKAVHHGEHYLKRYFDLIVFNSYLHENFDPVEMQLSCSFSEWMEERVEIHALIDRIRLK